MITEMLRIDNTFDNLPISDRKKQHQLLLSEKVDAYFAWIKQKYAQITPKQFHRQSSCIQHQSEKTFACFPFRWQHSYGQ